MSPSLPSNPLNSVAAWRKEFEAYGIQSELVEKYLAYVKPLLRNKVPVIFNFDHLGDLLGRNSTYLASVINGSERHYRKFEIPKRSGGSREILAPYPALKECQWWIYHNILCRIQINDSAHGFIQDRSILTNAKAHLEGLEYLKIDIKDYFPSIGINRVIALFKKLGYSHTVSFYLASICCNEGRLPQGAPTSPCLSNIISRLMDFRLTKLSEGFGIKYTRYADDMTFSGNKVPWKFYEYAAKIIRECGFEIQQSKTKLLKRPRSKIVTGIAVSARTLHAPKEYKRKLRAEIYSIKKFGVLQHLKHHKKRQANTLESLLGKIGFVLMIEPENKFFIQAKQDLEAIK